jgi:hypothetical protein
MKLDDKHLEEIKSLIKETHFSMEGIDLLEKLLKFTCKDEKMVEGIMKSIRIHSQSHGLLDDLVEIYAKELSLEDAIFLRKVYQSDSMKNFLKVKESFFSTYEFLAKKIRQNFGRSRCSSIRKKSA